jgi:XisI protein
MDKIKKYQTIITQLLHEMQSPEQDNEAEQEVIITDTKRHHYFLQWIGFDADDCFINKPLVHFHIKPNGKIWILANRTETDIAEALMRKGVAKKEIVLGFLEPLVRAHSGFAVA